MTPFSYDRIRGHEEVRRILFFPYKKAPSPVAGKLLKILILPFLLSACLARIPEPITNSLNSRRCRQIMQERGIPVPDN